MAISSGTIHTIAAEKRLKTGNINRENDDKMWQKMGNVMSHRICLPKYVSYDWFSVNIERGDLKKNVDRL